MASINDLATAATAVSASASASTLDPAAAMEGDEPSSSSSSSAVVIPPSSVSAASAAPAADESRPEVVGKETEAEMQGVERQGGEGKGAREGVVRGALIVLEGLDRSGKTTQVKLLEQRFVEMGRRVKVMRFPDRTTPIGQMIDGYLRSQVEMDDHAIHLLFSANRWEAVKTITAHLAAGTSVVCDRYYHSGIVYSAAKRNPLLSLSWARAPEVGLPRPDLVLFLDLDEAQARARGGWGGEVYERAEMQRRVRSLFLGLSRGVKEGMETADGDGGMDVDVDRQPDAGVDVPPEAVAGGNSSAGMETGFEQEREDLRVVGASPSVEEVAEKVWGVVKGRVEAVERGEVGSAVRRLT